MKAAERQAMQAFIVAAVNAAVSRAVKSIELPTPEPGPPGKDGAPGQDGRDGIDGTPGEKGMDGKDGRDGRDGIAKDGKDGRDGKDGIASRDELNSLVVSEVEKRFEAEVQKRIDAAIGALPLMLYKGVWREEESYREGNTVTFGGSGWVCMKSDTTEKPGTGSDWILAIKKGRDGRDAK